MEPTNNTDKQTLKDLLGDLLFKSIPNESISDLSISERVNFVAEKISPIVFDLIETVGLVHLPR